MSQRLIVVGHRGAPTVAPENSMPGFEAALASSADGIELDVQWTADGTPVVVHDVRLDRTTTGTGQVREHTLRALRTVRLLDAAGQASQWTVPTLSEVACTFGADTRLLVEVKIDDAPAPAARGRNTALTLKRARPTHPPMVLSFAAEALVAARTAWAGLTTCLLVRRDSPASTEDSKPVVAAARAAGASGLGVVDVAVSKELATAAHGAGLILYSWGNNSRSLAEAGLAAGTDVMASDDPGALVRLLQARRA